VRGVGKMVGAAIALGLVGGFAGFAYWTDVEFPFLSTPRIGSSTSAARADMKPLFRCEGKNKCSQMTSCEEAMFYLQHCPRASLDDDKDGIPCEVQWCQK
jgi:hypothetical protein